MKPLILSLILFLPAHAQDLETIPPKLNLSGADATPADPRAPQDVSGKALITGFGDAEKTKLLSEGTANIDFKTIFRNFEPEAEKQALRDLKAIYEQAIAEKNLELIKPHLAADFTAVMITADEVKDYAGIKDYWKKVEDFIGKDGTYTVSVVPDDTIFEGNIAIAKGIAKERVVRGGKDIGLTSRWTAIARKEGETWKLVRIQASIDPVSNPIITALNKGKLWLTGAVAAVTGILFGWLIGRRRKAK